MAIHLNGVRVPASLVVTGAEIRIGANNEEIQYDAVTLPMPIHLLNLHVDQRGDLHVAATADQSIDMASCG
jgi:hypothetical protein